MFPMEPSHVRDGKGPRKEIFFGEKKEIPDIMAENLGTNLSSEMADDILPVIRGLAGNHTNRHVAEWKSAGKPVVGYFCHYMPAELILAAGALPLRLRGAGSEDSSPGDAWLSGRVCTYVRHVMSLVLDGKYDFLDGAVCMNTCDHVRRAADVFVKKSSVPFNGFISVPRNPRESLFGYYVSELRKFIAGMEDNFGIKIGAGDFRSAIRTMNGTRDRLREINRMRMEDAPRISGADSLAAHIVSQVLPPEVFAGLADSLIEQMKSGPGLDSPRGRLVLIGAELDEPGYVEVIESQGAIVVADLLCFGARSALDPIDENAVDPVEAIARAYFFRPSCARMIGDFPRRWENLKRLVKDARADGVVFERLVFCDPWGAEIHNILNRAKEENSFPVLSLTREYGVTAAGQLRTRVQAFLEKLEIARARNSAGGL